MLPTCPHCSKLSDYVIDCRTIRPHGGFYRTSDSKSVKRYRCLLCKRTFSKATLDPCFLQKKRQKNGKILELLASANTGRRIARLLRIDRKTVARKLIFLGVQANEVLTMQTASSKVSALQFDDLETFEHTKFKPLSVTLAVEEKTRRILGFRVARIGAKGLLKEKSLKKYGKRKSELSRMRKDLLKELSPVVLPGATIKSDSNPHYGPDFKKFLPQATHLQILGKRGAVTGQGELKKIGFDPIFSLNHTCAMLRANISRLVRKTWATTKRIERLHNHIAIYAIYHNNHLKKAA